MARGDIHFVDFPEQQGREQRGHRPAIAVQVDTPGAQNLPTLLVVPVTGQLKRASQAFTFVVNPTATNGLTRQSVLLVNQLRAVDRKRLGRKIGTLEAAYLRLLERALRDVLGL
jgi:mRNA interferase MazF